VFVFTKIKAFLYDAMSLSCKSDISYIFYALCRGSLTQEKLPSEPSFSLLNVTIAWHVAKGFKERELRYS
jgi:hypothetical protein